MSMKVPRQRRVAGSDSNQCTGPAVLTCRVFCVWVCLCVCVCACLEFENDKSPASKNPTREIFCNLYFLPPCNGVAASCCPICKVTQPIIFLYNGNRPTLTDKILLVKKLLMLVFSSQVQKWHDVGEMQVTKRTCEQKYKLWNKKKAHECNFCLRNLCQCSRLRWLEQHFSSIQLCFPFESCEW